MTHALAIAYQTARLSPEHAARGDALYLYDVRDRPVIERVSPDRSTAEARGFNVGPREREQAKSPAGSVRGPSFWATAVLPLVNGDYELVDDTPVKRGKIWCVRIRCRPCGAVRLLGRADWLPRPGCDRPPPQRCGACNRKLRNEMRRSA